MTKTRLFAWVLLIAVLYGLNHVRQNWQNPWAAVPKSPVLSMLPVAAPGCGEDCKK